MSMRNANSRKTLWVIAALLVGAVLLALIVFFVIKPAYQLSVASRGSELGFDSSFQQVKSHCPTNVELEQVCLRSFYSQNSTAVIIKTAKETLVRNGYDVRDSNRGYDGANQTVTAAFNPEKNITILVIVTDTNNEAYKKSQGNIRVESHFGDRRPK